MTATRVAWYNGETMPEADVRIPFRDLGFIYGDSVYDTARTFNGIPHLVDDHVDRLFASLKYVMIDVPYDRQTIVDVTKEIAEKNKALLGPDMDYWVCQRVSSGVQTIEGEAPLQSGPTFIIECKPIPFKARAPMFRDGIDAVISSQRRFAPDALSPNAKTSNYLNMLIGAREVAAIAPHAWAVLLDHKGYVCEGAGCNIFFVRDGRVVTPPRESVLPGVSRRLVIELCVDVGVECAEEPITLFDAATADEAFFSATSLCMCPLRSFNGRQFELSPGPITARLMDAYKQRVGFDFVAQFLAHL
ncbi:MAG: aminotransferase class IV [Pseudomonadota bacterium]